MGICEETAIQDYDVVVTTVKEDDITFLKRLIHNQKVDGVILTRSLVNDAPANFLKECGIPFVVIGSCEDNEIIQIDNNHVEAPLRTDINFTDIRKPVFGFISWKSESHCQPEPLCGFCESISGFKD